MKYDLLIKSFIAFCVGVIIYKFISDRCSCDVVEGNFLDDLENKARSSVSNVANKARSAVSSVINKESSALSSVAKK